MKLNSREKTIIAKRFKLAYPIIVKIKINSVKIPQKLAIFCEKSEIVSISDV